MDYVDEHLLDFYGNYAVVRRPRLRSMFAAAVAFLCALAVQASAAEPLTVNQCLDVDAGLKALDYVGAGLRETTPKPPGAQQYKLGQLRWVIARNQAALKVVTDATDRARNALILEIGGDKPIQVGSIEMTRFLLEFQKILDKPCEVTPARIKVEDLKLGDGPDQNAIPPSVLAALAPILD